MPANDAKARKQAEDHARFRDEAVGRITALAEGDLPGMMSTLCVELIHRRREAELDIIRLHEFHPEDVANLSRVSGLSAAYGRRLSAASAIHKLVGVFGDEESLRQALLAWAESSGKQPQE